MTFAHPLLLLLLLLLPAAVATWVLLQRRLRMRYALAFTNLELLATVAERRGTWRRALPPLLFLLALGTLCAAVARPKVHRLVPVDRATVILVVDASRSMQSNDVKPTRLAAAEEAVRTFLRLVPKRLQVGLVVFAGDAQVAAPVTTDHDLVRRSLSLVENYPGFSGTAIGDALQVAVGLGEQAVSGPVSNGPTIAFRVAAPSPGTRPPVAILFLSDGRQTTGSLSPLAGAELARRAGFPVYTVALGTNHGSLPGFGSSGFGQGRFNLAPDRVALRAIAVHTGGAYFPAQTAAAAHAAYTKLGSHLGRRPATSEVTFAFLLGAAGLLVLAGIGSVLWAPRLP